MAQTKEITLETQLQLHAVNTRRKRLSQLSFKLIKVHHFDIDSNTGGPRYMREIGTPKNWLAYNKFAYKNTKDDRKLEDRFQKKGHFWIAYTRNRR